MRKIFLTYSCLFTGAFLQGMSMSLFLFPHSIPSGGAAGIALLINYWFDLSLGFSLWLANVIFLLFALNYFGYTWTFRTVLSVATTSATISFFNMYLAVKPNFLLFDMGAGSLFFGLGVGLLIRAGASSGGMVIPALMIAFHKNWSPGKVMMGINLFVFLLTSIVIDYKIVLYAIICQFMSTNVIDYIYQIKFRKIASLAVSWRRR